MIKQETINKFKNTIKKLVKKTNYNPSDSLFNILVLDINDKKDRIEFCGYDKQTKLFYGAYLPFIGSPIKVIVHVPHKNRTKLTNDPDCRIKEDGVDWDDHYKGDIFLMYSNNAFMTKYNDNKDVSIFSIGLPIKRIKEIIQKERLIKDVDKMNYYGLYPITNELIPEIDGVPPETINPNKTDYLEKIIEKITKTAILNEKDIK